MMPRLFRGGNLRDSVSTIPPVPAKIKLYRSKQRKNRAKDSREPGRSRQADFLEGKDLKRQYERENIPKPLEDDYIKKDLLSRGEVSLQFFGGKSEDKRSQEFVQAIADGTVNLKLKKEKQLEHIEGTKRREERIQNDKKDGKHSTYFFAGTDVQKMLDGLFGTGDVRYSSPKDIYPKEFLSLSVDSAVGMAYNKAMGEYVPTKRVCIRYSSKGYHAYPVEERSDE